jgi:Tfp pilus assembly protein PilF
MVREFGRPATTAGDAANREHQIRQGRSLFDLAVKDIAAGNFVSAQRNLRMALVYDPNNARYRWQLAEAEKKLPKPGFKIR